MWLYAARRIVLTIPILLGVTVICFALVHIAPGDPIQNLLSPTATAEDAARLRAAYGLDQPIASPIFDLARQSAASATWGPRSPATRRLLGEVTAGFQEYDRHRADLVVLAFVFSMIFGIVAAYRSGKLSDRLITASLSSASVCRRSGSACPGDLLRGDLSWLPATGHGSRRLESFNYFIGTTSSSPSCRSSRWRCRRLAS